MNKCKGCLKPIIMLAGQVLCFECRDKVQTLPEHVQRMALTGLVALRSTCDLLPIDAFINDMREAHDQYLKDMAGLS